MGEAARVALFLQKLLGKMIFIAYEATPCNF